MTSKMFLEQGEAGAYEPECMVSAGIYCKQGWHLNRCVSRSSSSASTASLPSASLGSLPTDYRLPRTPHHWRWSCPPPDTITNFKTGYSMLGRSPGQPQGQQLGQQAPMGHVGSCPPPRRIFKLHLPSWFMAKSCRFLGISSTTPLVCGTTVGHAPEQRECSHQFLCRSRVSCSPMSRSPCSQRSICSSTRMPGDQGQNLWTPAVSWSMLQWTAINQPTWLWTELLDCAPPGRGGLLPLPHGTASSSGRGSGPCFSATEPCQSSGPDTLNFFQFWWIWGYVTDPT